MEADKPSRSDASPSKEKSQQGKGQFTTSDQLVYYNEQLSRVEEEQLKKKIHQSMVAITFMDANKKINTGSGVLISRNIVLTAAQNIFNKELNAENTDFKIYLRANGEAEEYHQVEAWKYPRQFQTCEQSTKLPHNYAIMKLKKPVDFSQYLSLSLACKECLLRDNKKIKLKVFGFPCAYPPDAFGNVRSFEDNFEPLDASGKRMKLYQYGLAHEGRITVVEAEQSKIGYDISTLPGQSGCPVLANGNIIAVHMGGYKARFNVGRIVDASFMNRLWKWREKLNAAPFQLEYYDVCQHVKPTLKKMEQKLNLEGKKLKSMDLREYGNLLELNLRGNQLRQIDLAHCPRLTRLNLIRNQLKRIDLSKHKHLTHLYLGKNKLQQMDVRNNANLTCLDMSHNKLQEMDVRNNVNLTYIDLSCNKLQEMDVRNNVNLTELNLRQNQLQEMDMRNNVNLTCLTLSHNKLQEMDLRNNVNLTSLSLSSNKLQEIEVRNNVNLTSLSLSSNKLQEMDLRNNVNLNHLWLPFNRIAEIDLTKNTKLEFLQVKNNRLARVRLCISKNVREETYINYRSFDLSNQQSAVCRVQLLCEGQGLAARGKAIRIVDDWMQKYSRNYRNEYKCAYSFLAF